ncbi:MAG: hypothetical protein IJV07_03555 [Alphaproteobacteria bacterium]|nr:hypothetical protein [Alphaproteobacteria bacterium]
MSLTSVDICSHALVKLGAGSISSFNEDTTEAHVAKQLYDITVEALLASYPWRFALKQVHLPRLLNQPDADYRYAYALPKDCVRVLSAGAHKRGRGLNYRIAKQQLQTDSDSVILTYLAKPDEADFPAFFTKALISKLAAEFCLPLTESTSRTDYLLKLAAEDIQNARLIDSQQAVPQAFQDFSLIGVRQ